MSSDPLQPERLLRYTGSSCVTPGMSGLSSIGKGLNGNRRQWIHEPRSFQRRAIKSSVSAAGLRGHLHRTIDHLGESLYRATIVWDERRPSGVCRTRRTECSMARLHWSRRHDQILKARGGSVSVVYGLAM